MRQTVFFGFGATQRLPRVLEQMQAKRVFLVTGEASFASSGADQALSHLLSAGCVFRYSGFTENPKLQDVITGIAALRADRFDVVMAVGGGTVMDVAKLVNLLAHQQHQTRNAADLSTPVHGRGLPFIAMPTTSGSGSEATHFAVVYVGRVKHSVASTGMVPDVAIVDPALTRSLPARVTAVTGMDALAQAVESFWSIHSTDESKGYARRAIQLAWDHLPAAVIAPSDRARRAMSKAAFLAGRAINITKTTGAHALSYPLTSHFGIPHGHAVCLTLGEFMVFNAQVNDNDVADARGAGYVRATVAELIRMMGGRDADDCRIRIRELMRAVGLQTDLAALGVSRHEAMNVVVGNVNTERLVNNPRALTHAHLEQLVSAVC